MAGQQESGCVVEGNVLGLYLQTEDKMCIGLLELAITLYLKQDVVLVYEQGGMKTCQFTLKCVNWIPYRCLCDPFMHV